MLHSDEFIEISAETEANKRRIAVQVRRRVNIFCRRRQKTGEPFFFDGTRCDRELISREFQLYDISRPKDYRNQGEKNAHTRDDDENVFSRPAHVN